MPDDFDPYYQWLGISPKDQPPHHYRLLGIELFESHADVIAHAADRQMAHVRSFQAGKNAQASQQILNELSAARICLLDAEKKPVYDEHLQSQIAAREMLQDVDTAAFGEYLLIDLLDASSTGQVFKAKHRTMGRVVALKILADNAAKSPELADRFQLKVGILARLNHPNLVTAYDAGQRDGTHFLVMEYVDGRDLFTLMKHSLAPLPIPQVLDYIKQAAAGLGYLHSQSIYHRNVKPSNLMVDKQGAVKVIGMGLARFSSRDALAESGIEIELNEAGRVLGTIDYMAPEQTVDSSRIDHRADIYALGCTLYALLTRQFPFPVPGQQKKINAHRSGAIPSLRTLRSDVPESLDAVFQKMLAKLPQDRQQSMAEVTAALQACETHLTTTPIPALPMTGPAAIDLSETLRPPTKEPAEPGSLDGFLGKMADEQPHWKRRNR